jgi:hypothetical protein
MLIMGNGVSVDIVVRFITPFLRYCLVETRMLFTFFACNTTVQPNYPGEIAHWITGASYRFGP